MNRYIFDTHYGVSTVTDTENDVAVSWNNGKYNDTNAVNYFGDETDPIKIARMCRELGDYIAENYSELI